jgi:4,5-dihydroxyphthalate decarboxylase
VLSGDEHVAEYWPPANVVSMEPGSTLEDLLISGDLDAVIGVEVRHPDVAPLIADPTNTAFDALRHQGLYPINHLVVVKDELLQQYPDLAADVFDAFGRAKELYVQQLRAGTLQGSTATDHMYARVMEVTGADPLPYGIEQNRATIETLIDNAVNQAIIDRPIAVDSLFAESTRQLQA